MNEALKTLFHPFETGDLDPPGDGRRVLFLGAEPGFRLPEGFSAELSLVQGFRPWFNALTAAGCQVSPVPEGEGYDAALVLAGRHRGENEARLAEAILRVKEDGLVLMAGAKSDGIAALHTRLGRNPDLIRQAIRGEPVPSPIIDTTDGRTLQEGERLFHGLKAPMPLEGHLSKYHGLAFWLRRTPAAEAFARQDVDGHVRWPLIDGRFRTAPGMFSFDRVDAGSRLLADHLPADAKGAAADFGAGWGFLSAALAERARRLSRIDLYEADFASLEAAKLNLTDGGGPEFRFFWRDLTREAAEGSYELIVMNPPFHTGRAAEPQIGVAFIQAAAKALRRGGRLLMVANRGLPYEKALGEAFRETRELARAAGFKVLEAIR